MLSNHRELRRVTKIVSVLERLIYDETLKEFSMWSLAKMTATGQRAGMRIYEIFDRYKRQGEDLFNVAHKRVSLEVIK